MPLRHAVAMRCQDDIAFIELLCFRYSAIFSPFSSPLCCCLLYTLMPRFPMPLRLPCLIYYAACQPPFSSPPGYSFSPPPAFSFHFIFITFAILRCMPCHFRMADGCLMPFTMPAPATLMPRLRYLMPLPRHATSLFRYFSMPCHYFSSRLFCCRFDSFSPLLFTRHAFFQRKHAMPRDGARYAVDIFTAFSFHAAPLFSSPLYYFFFFFFFFAMPFSPLRLRRDDIARHCRQLSLPDFQVS